MQNSCMLEAIFFNEVYWGLGKMDTLVEEAKESGKSRPVAASLD